MSFKLLGLYVRSLFFTAKYLNTGFQNTERLLLVCKL